MLFQAGRRHFLKGAALLGGLSLLPASVIACSDEDTPVTGTPKPENHLTVARSGGDFSKLSDALSQISDASEENRYTISVYGRLDETVTLVAKSYVDVIGFSADVAVSSNRDIPAVDFNDVVSCSWRGLTVRRQGTVPDGAVCAVFRGTTDATCRIDQCRFLNQTTGGINCHGISIRDAAAPAGEFVGIGGGGGEECMGIDIMGAAAPSGAFRGTGGPVAAPYPAFGAGIRIAEDASPRGEFYGDGGSGSGRNVGINICNQARPSGTFTGRGGDQGDHCYGLRIVDSATPSGKFFGYGGNGGEVCIGMLLRINASPTGEFFCVGGQGGREGSR